MRLTTSVPKLDVAINSAEAQLWEEPGVSYSLEGNKHKLGIWPENSKSKCIFTELGWKGP